MFSDEELERLWASEPKQEEGESMSAYMKRYTAFYDTLGYTTPAKKVVEIKTRTIRSTQTPNPAKEAA